MKGGMHSVGMVCGWVVLVLGILWLVNDLNWFVLYAGIPYGPLVALALGIHYAGMCPMCK
jgi:hypothetical protein